MKGVTVIALCQVFLKNCSKVLHRMFYTSLYKCILQNMKHVIVKVMFV